MSEKSKGKVLYHMYLDIEVRDKLVNLAKQKTIENKSRVTITELIRNAIKIYDNEPVKTNRDMTPWDAYETNYLLHHTKKGTPLKQVAKVLDRTITACESKMKRMRKQGVKV
jgi:hypothetical protein